MKERKSNSYGELLTEIDEIHMKGLMNTILEIIDAMSRFYEPAEEHERLANDAQYRELKSQFETLLNDYGKRLDRLKSRFGVK